MEDEPEVENQYLSQILTEAIQSGDQNKANSILQLLQEIDATIEVIELDAVQSLPAPQYQSGPVANAAQVNRGK
ncbi:unnamed protein product [Blepharisma stoltei]|uniref:Uncharacterized protein n=1 Tax=Blepharisma stoltei TaxID=1481888 RepID=A0AAU9JW44_9CILI|nr:unnamed protein product [Blepharisma stoltei]